VWGSSLVLPPVPAANLLPAPPGQVWDNRSLVAEAAKLGFQVLPCRNSAEPMDRPLTFLRARLQVLLSDGWYLDRQVRPPPPPRLPPRTAPRTDTHLRLGRIQTPPPLHSVLGPAAQRNSAATTTCGSTALTLLTAPAGTSTAPQVPVGHSTGWFWLDTWQDMFGVEPLAGLAEADAAAVVGGEACMWSEQVGGRCRLCP
jgi:hypothetical protein